MSARQKLNRRHFLQTTGAATAAGYFAGTSSLGNAQESPNERPVFATIGLRNQGWTITNKSFKYADFAAMADVDANVLGENIAKAKEQQGTAPEGYADYRKLLERKDIDAVMIAAPDHWHTKISVEAMLAGKDVYCEKPLTLTIDEGKLIEKVVKQTGRVFQVGTMQRTENNQRFLQAIAMIRDGRIGEIRKVTCGIGGATNSPVIPAIDVPEGLDWDFWLGPAPKVPYRALPEMRKGYGGGVPLYTNCHYAWRNWYEYSGGQMNDWGAHHVDIATWALGADQSGPSKITPVSFSLPVDYKDGHPTVSDQYNSPTKFEIHANMPGDIPLVITSEGDNGIMFEGTKGRFFVNRGKIVGKPVEDLESNPLPEDAIENVYGGPVAANHTDNFVQAMRSRKQPISDVWTHNRMLETCHLANIAIRLGRELNWDPTKREIVGDDEANSFLSRESRKGYEIDM
ncbi:MAG TPA: oxidoreductase [Rhodopirellula baltica]|uniref:Oxidoreductase, Gfo/Idh/MocA family n=2 Tax=Rhodopirellula baltica TaxID=265606 RepID=K5CB03_RHOBT|nr:Gfo/Idh/MocA family oxidoreductase [Rhodopirellula baltica]EKK00520.1 oxidoreductase, Gfo/Idh/MocA family [Rhodopirellula baltica SH28]HBE62045.1 oxidoreductase [Rhodopirellula baltica]